MSKPSQDYFFISTPVQDIFSLEPLISYVIKFL